MLCFAQMKGAAEGGGGDLKEPARLDISWLKQYARRGATGYTVSVVETWLSLWSLWTIFVLKIEGPWVTQFHFEGSDFMWF